ncbi:hypothetical protein HAX54_048262, partial [Datura stramonium]|nr:hypothetical protein [Datura stramonium]
SSSSRPSRAPGASHTPKAGRDRCPPANCQSGLVKCRFWYKASGHCPDPCFTWALRVKTGKTS